MQIWVPSTWQAGWLGRAGVCAPVGHTVPFLCHSMSEEGKRSSLKHFRYRGKTVWSSDSDVGTQSPDLRRPGRGRRRGGLGHAAGPGFRGGWIHVGNLTDDYSETVPSPGFEGEFVLFRFSVK